MSAPVDVVRYDRAPLARAVRTDEGFLVAPANLTRTGVFEYVQPDGSTRRELRLDADVFAPSSLATYQGKPVTRGHPAELLTAATAKGRVVGALSDVRRADDGKHVSATVAIYDAETIAAVDEGERELSVGYKARLEPVPGGKHRMDDGTTVEADFYQRDIRANHTAIVRRGRAGESASIRLDSAGHQTAGAEPEEPKMTITPEQLKALEAERDTLKAELAKVRTDGAAELAKAKAEAETVKAALGDLTKRLDAHDAKEKQETHRALCDRVAPITGDKLDDLVKLDSAEVQRKALTKLTPSLDLAGKDNAFIGAAFETAMSLPRHDTAGIIAGGVLSAQPRNDGDPIKQLEEARAAARKAAADASKKV